MEFDVIAYLAQKGLRGKPASGGREMTYPCFFDCAESPASNKRKLYINANEGFFHCKVCGSSGGTWLLQKHFGDMPDRDAPDDTFMRRRILDSATKLGQQMLNENDDVLVYLMTERGLDPETIEERQLGFVAAGWSLTGSLPEEATNDQLRTTGLVYREGPRAGKDFFFRHLLIPYISRGHCIQMRGRAWGDVGGGKYMTGPGEPPRIYNADSLDDADDVIITEGEFDAIALAQALAQATEPRIKKIAVIGLPGTSAIPEELDDRLSTLKRVFIGFDNDEPGKAAALKLQDRIGKRARILQLPNEDGRKCDWTEYLLPAEGKGDWKVRHPYAGHTYKDVVRLLSSASGRRIRSIFEARTAWENHNVAHAGLKTGYTVIDEIIRPGLLPGQVWVVLAKTGTGKTLFLCNLAYNMRQYTILLLSLEMTIEEVYERLRRVYLFHHPFATEEEITEGLKNIYICDENQIGEKDIPLLVEEYDIENDQRPQVVMVDYLGYFARTARGHSPYEKVSNAVMQLKADAKASRSVIISPGQVNRGAKDGKPIDLDDARDSGAIEETADFLTSLYRPDESLAAAGDNSPQPLSGAVKCEFLKSRHGGKGRKVDLLLDNAYLAMVDDTPDMRLRIRSRNEKIHRGDQWTDIHRIVTAPRQTVIRYDS